MIERRKHKRLDLDVSIRLEALNKDGTTTSKFEHVDVTDISRSGLGFKFRLQMNNTVGIIDSDYFYSDNEGHIFVKLKGSSIIRTRKATAR